MIQRFSFGHPFPTQSVVLTLPAESGPVPFLTPDGSGWRFTLSEQAAVYGLGEMPRGINKRGWHYIANNTDESRHSEDKLSFYGAHNFLLVRDGSTCFGLFVDFPGKVITTSVIPATIFSLSTPRLPTMICISSPAGTRMRSARSSAPSSAAATSRPGGHSVWHRAAGATRPRRTCGRLHASTRSTTCRWT